jgi:hypothetical protein
MSATTIKKQNKTVHYGDRDWGLNWLMTMIFKMGYPVWKLHNGAVPQGELEKLAERGDWPRGLAAAVMARLNRDKELRKQLEHEYF